MHYRQISLTVDGTYWQIGNPYLPTHTAPAGSANRTPVVAAATAAGSGTVLGAAAVAASAAAPTVFAVAGIGAVAAGGAAFGWLGRRHTAKTRRREAADQALHATVGATHLTRSVFTEPELRDGCDRAVRGAAAIVASAAFSRGALGSPDTVGHDLQCALWDVVHAFADLDERSRDYRRAETSIATHRRDQDDQVAEAVHRQLAADAAPLFEQAAAFDALAQQAADLDSRFAGPAINESLSDSLRPTRHRTDGAAIDRVAGSLAAARDVTDAEGLL